MIIYKITCKVNNKIYIGQTIKTVEQRWKEHVGTSIKGQSLFCRAIRKYGPDSFLVEVIESCSTEEDLNLREIFWIKEFSSFGDNGYNLTEGGQGCSGYHHTKDMKLHLSEIHKGRKFSDEHLKNLGLAQKERMKRSPHSEEARKKMSEGARNRKISEEHKKIISESNRLRALKNPMSGERRNSFKERMQSIEAAEKRKESMKNFRHSEETKKKMSEKKKGRKLPPRTEEHKQKLSESKRKLDEERKCKKILEEEKIGSLLLVHTD